MRSLFLAAAALALLVAPPAAAMRSNAFPPTKADIHLEMVFNSVLFGDGHLGEEKRRSGLGPVFGGPAARDAQIVLHPDPGRPALLLLKTR